MAPLRVALFPADETGCGTYRMRLPAAAAASTGEVETIFPLGSRRVLRDLPALDVDVAVFQRPAHVELLHFIPEIRQAGIAVVVDVDDDLAALHPRNVVFEALHPRLNREVNWQHIKTCCRLADLVTVSTAALAPRYGGQKARVLPNLVPRALLDITAERDGRTIGWGGFTATHPDDLKVTNGGVAMAIDDTGARFLQVGDPEGVKRDLRLRSHPESTGPVPFGDYHQALAQLDVTIAPLADSQFNRGKSGLKVLEAAALGIACVASPRPEYERLAGEGLCTLAKDRFRDWRRECAQLLADHALREDRAAQARQAIAERHTYENAGWRWVEAWTEAINRLNRDTRAARVAA